MYYIIGIHKDTKFRPLKQAFTNLFHLYQDITGHSRTLQDITDYVVRIFAMTAIATTSGVSSCIWHPERKRNPQLATFVFLHFAWVVLHPLSSSYSLTEALYMAWVKHRRKDFPFTAVKPLHMATMPQPSAGLHIMMLLRPYAPPVCPTG